MHYLLFLLFFTASNKFFRDGRPFRSHFKSFTREKLQCRITQMNFISQTEVVFFWAKGNDEYHRKVVSKNNLCSVFFFFFSICLSLLLQKIKRKTSLPDNFW